MEDAMFAHPATQGHLATLGARGATVVGPETGRLASGKHGAGRLAAPETIVGAVRLVLGHGGPLAGRRVVVTAGGTREPLDPVRFLGNRSSGRMGFGGAAVELIATTATPSPPYGATLTLVETAAELERAVAVATRDADALLMAAAVADFRPAAVATGKIKKRNDQDTLDLALVRNPDILAGLDRPGLVKIGFAAETDDLLANARAKLAAKRLDMIVANDAVATIGHAASTAILLRPDREPEHLPTMPKDDLAALILTRLVELLPPRAAAART
jgi:phosphopantothenoylcysteine decarboxylase/phosphopantothenate--cysteine ligase